MLVTAANWLFRAVKGHPEAAASAVADWLSDETDPTLWLETRAVTDLPWLWATLLTVHSLAGEDRTPLRLPRLCCC